MSLRNDAIFHPPSTNFPHRLGITNLQLRCIKQRTEHQPRVLPPTVPQHLLLVFISQLAVKRVPREDLPPHVGCNSAIKEIRVIRRTIPKQVPKLRLERGPRCMRDQTARVIQVRERGRRIEAWLEDGGGMIYLVEH